MELYLDIGILALALGVIWIFSDKLIIAIHSIAERFGIPESIAGATLAAIGSSFPEFLTSVFAVVLSGLNADEGGGGYADVGFGTIVGSAIFNICIIIGVSAFFRRLTVARRVVTRDCVWYLVTTVTAVVFVADGQVTLVEGLIWVGMYLVYCVVLLRDIKRHPEEAKEQQEEVETVSAGKAWLYFLLSIAVMGVACHFLVEKTAAIGGRLGVPSALLSLLAIAAGTSIPDTLASIQAARKGLTSLAISNAIGSNVFDILICLGLPMAIYSGVTGQAFDLGQLPDEMKDLEGVARTLIQFGLFCLVLSVALSILFIRTGWVVNKAEGLCLIVLYVFFVAGAIGIFWKRVEVDFESGRPEIHVGARAEPATE